MAVASREAVRELVEDHVRAAALNRFLTPHLAEVLLVPVVAVVAVAVAAAVALAQAVDLATKNAHIAVALKVVADMVAAPAVAVAPVAVVAAPADMRPVLCCVVI